MRNTLENVREIPLTRGFVAIVDAADYCRLNQWKWRALRNKRAVYAVRSGPLQGGRRRTILMHRVIVGAGSGVEVDHINGNGLDNTRANLRLASRAENGRNQRLSHANISGYKGVYSPRGTTRWCAGIKLNGRHIHIGSFDTPEEAARAYDAKALELFGDFAHLNFLAPSGGSK